MAQVKDDRLLPRLYEEEELKKLLENPFLPFHVQSLAESHLLLYRQMKHKCKGGCDCD